MKSLEKGVYVSAGDVLTAKLVEQSGFDGIWISGFEASARLGLPDNGSITMTEMMNIARPIVDAVKIPVWVDADTGYGNFQRTVSEFEKIGVTGVCVQDDLPHLKKNSLWGGKAELMSAEEFGEKIKVKRSKIKVMARTEAIIRGHGQREANERLCHYLGCGADVILPHVRDVKDLIFYSPNPERNIAIVPTKFPYFTNQQLFMAGYSMVIWANQTERCKIKATRDCLGSLKGSDCAEFIESNLSATLDEMKGLTE